MPFQRPAAVDVGATAACCPCDGWEGESLRRVEGVDGRVGAEVGGVLKKFEDEGAEEGEDEGLLGREDARNLVRKVCSQSADADAEGMV